MKRLIIGLSLILSASSLFAGSTPQSREEWMRTPSPSYVSEGVHRSTYMTLLIPSTFSVIISSYPCTVHTVSIASVTPSSALDFYDQSMSTVEATTPVMFTIDNSRAWQYPPFDMFFSSGLVIIPRGSVNPRSTITYRER